MKTPISVCIIVRNDPIGLENCILSFKDYVDDIVIVDTGSTDNTPEIAKKYANRFEIFTKCNDPETGLIENFSLARQRSFNLAKNDAVMWIDSDDILVGAEKLPQILEEAKKIEPLGGSTCFLFPYEYAYSPEGACICRHYRERLITNKNDFEFVNRIHEVLIPKDNSKCLLINREELVFKHKRQYNNKAVDPNRNLRILKKVVEIDGSQDLRQFYYLGLEYCNVGDFDNAIKYLTKYVASSGWPDEAAMATLKLVDIYQVLNNFEEGLRWAFKTIEIKHNWGEGYFAVGKLFYHLAMKGGPQEIENWKKCAHFIKTGLSFPPTQTLLFINPMERESEIYKYYNMALNKLGDIKGALESVNIGILKQPNDYSFINNKKLYEEHLAKQEIVSALNTLISIGSISKESIDAIFNILTPKLTETKQNSLPTINNGKLDIIFALGDGVEIWNSETLKKTGLGGSETMAAELAKRLVSLGHRVRIYNSCGQPGIYDGIEYYPTSMYQNLNCDVLIISRNAQLLDDSFNIKAKLKLLWVHDVCVLNAKNALLLKADRILALSEWHKQNLIAAHNIHPDHILVTHNAINLDRFNNKKINRNKYKCINSSSPDRSWSILLNIWPKIKERIPQAELHLLYGFKNWEHVAQYYPGQPELIARLKEQIKILEPLNVVYHGRVNQDQLAEEFLSSGAWIHPTWFTETSCLTAMEAQAAGCRIVTSSIAALNETVADRGILIPGNWTTPEYQEKFINSVITAMTIEDNSDREIIQNYAKEHFCLNKLAQEWDRMFYSLIEELKTNPLVSYQPTPKYK